MTSPATSFPETRGVLLGLVGEGIGASLTPAMQEREGAHHGLRLTYRSVDADVHGFGVDDLAAVLRWARAFGFDGLNVTHPFKQAVVPLLDDLSEDAHDLGAVNTVVFREGRAMGHNTDASGFARSMRTTLPDAGGDRVVLLGAGGAGVAVGYALLALGAAHVAVHDVDRDRAEAAVARLQKRYAAQRVRVAGDLAAELSAADGLVNATPVGMVGFPGLPLAADLVRGSLWVADVVYFPLETELVALARSRGCRVVPGGGMAVGQAIDAFAHFTGREADADRVAAHFEQLAAARLATLGI